MLFFRDRKGRFIECESFDVCVQIEVFDGSINDVEVIVQNGGKYSVSYILFFLGQYFIYVIIWSCMMNESLFVVIVLYELCDYENINYLQLVIGGFGGEVGQLKGVRGVVVDKGYRFVVCDWNNFCV